MRLLPSHPLSLALAATSLAAGPASRDQPEYQIKASFVMILAEYVSWPWTAGGRSLVLGILGAAADAPLRDSSLFARGVKGRPLELRYFDNPKDCEGCDIVFICESEASRLPELLTRLRSRPILTIGDSPGLAQRGVMINLFREGPRVQFEINLAALRASGLDIRSNVLKLAKMVE